MWVHRKKLDLFAPTVHYALMKNTLIDNNMDVARVARQVGVSSRYIYLLLDPDSTKRPSPETARRLEIATGWSRLWWMYPHEYSRTGSKNPVPPHG
jgi:hypothetical protein